MDAESSVHAGARVGLGQYRSKGLLVAGNKDTIAMDPVHDILCTHPRIVLQLFQGRRVSHVLHNRQGPNNYS